jgi:hypothetical protein
VFGVNWRSIKGLLRVFGVVLDFHNTLNSVNEAQKSFFRGFLIDNNAEFQNRGIPNAVVLED